MTKIEFIGKDGKVLKVMDGDITENFINLINEAAVNVKKLYCITFKNSKGELIQGYIGGWVNCANGNDYELTGWTSCAWDQYYDESKDEKITKEWSIWHAKHGWRSVAQLAGRNEVSYSKAA